MVNKYQILALDVVNIVVLLKYNVYSSLVLNLL